VADMVPLLGENRYLVKRGLELINNSPRLGIKEMIDQCGLTAGSLESETISWTIAPLLNAAGRLDHAMGSYRLLMTDSPEEARELARWLRQKNTERQSLTVKSMALAREQALEQQDAPVMIVSGMEYPAGIIGLVAGRLTDEFYRPVVVIRTGERVCGGSCRSIPEFNIIEALNRCGHLLTHFGGHARAAGLGLRTGDLPRFRRELSEIAAAELEGIDLRPRVDIDAEVSLSSLAGDVYPTIREMAPFGQGNPSPVFLSRGVTLEDCRTMGNGGDHLRLRVSQAGSVWDAVGFGLGRYQSELRAEIDIVYSMEIDRWQGNEKLRLNIADFQPAD